MDITNKDIANKLIKLNKFLSNVCIIRLYDPEGKEFIGEDLKRKGLIPGWNKPLEYNNIPISNGGFLRLPPL